MLVLRWVEVREFIKLKIMYDKESIFATISIRELFDDLGYNVDINLFEKTMKEYSNIMARAQMGGSEGIHKPTSGNPDRLRR